VERLPIVWVIFYLSLWIVLEHYNQAVITLREQIFARILSANEMHNEIVLFCEINPLSARWVDINS